MDTFFEDPHSSSQKDALRIIKCHIALAEMENYHHSTEFSTQT